jgi:protein-disulfide isomerase
MKQIIIAVVVVVGIIAGATLLGGKDDSTTVGAASDNWYGQEKGIITLTEYGDFQCPACGQFFPIIKQVKEQFKDQIRFEFRHFPLVQIHPNATSAHRAAQAAANQGKFWEMHDLMYGNQESWNVSKNSSAIFETYARQIGLDEAKYKTDAESSGVLAIINADIAMGKDLKVSGTPTFFIDGKVIEDTNSIASVADFSKVLQAAIDAKQGTQTTTPTN